MNPRALRFAPSMLAAVSFACCVPFAGAADLPSGESLLQRFVDRSGGAEVYAKAKNAQMSGQVEIAGRNITGHVSIAEEGEKSWTGMDLPGIGRIEQGYDGKTAWELSAVQGPRILEGDEKSAMRRASSLTLPTSWRKEYKQMRTLGSEDIGGKAAWKVEMTPREGKAETFYFDKDSALLIRMSSVVTTPLGDIPTDVTVSDYRPVDGIQTPFTITQKAMDQTIVMTFETIAYNTPIAKDRFDLPPEVKALAAKQKAQ